MIKGRAASPVRTGRFIRSFMESHRTPYIAEIHYALREAWREVNSNRPRRNHVKSPTYESFRKYFAHLVTLGLVELVKETEMEEGPPGSPLLTIKEGEVVESVRRHYRITASGLTDDEAWEDPMKALGYYPRGKT